ncbi:MAG: ATP synthase epsilon chain [uncultured Gemmatimonadetes bacterium]|jgi:F-type H+-transporting ATPase subunit epsilon|uniref:ATP synthase epsilon chain n=1 Tax=uncultured Gemmatimonadota bacterium TaxID=203437 RepID=A0A6J4KB40_9BACT|nr:MAG: ATP synthase epsilon chain [uncultured Gemmatimonadota bacterium]
MAAPAAAAGTGAGALRVTVLSPEQTVFQGTADSVVAPAFNGKLGILRGHAPLMALLGEGELRVTTGGDERRFMVAGGFLQVADDEVTVLSERATPA